MDGELTKSGKVELVHRLAATVLPASTVIALVVALSAPVAWFVLKYWELDADARTRSLLLAGEMRRFMEESPDMWMYNSPKVAEHFQLLQHSGRSAFVEITDSESRVAYRFDPEAGPYVWQRMPIMKSGQSAGHVLVGVSSRRLLWMGVFLLVLFSTLGFLLSGFLYRMPLRTVRRSENSLNETMEQLRRAREELEQANEELERRVGEQTAGLRKAHALLLEQQEKLRQVAASTFASQEEDRLRISRDLHDTAGQMLTAVRIDLESVLQAMEEAPHCEDDRGSIRVLEHAVGLVDQTTGTIRQTIRVLGTPLLDQGGFERALGTLVSNFEHARCAIEVDVSQFKGSLHAVVESCAFRIVQEGVTNALRHGQASRIRIRVTETETDLMVEVEDDGTGYSAGSRQGFGLQSMKDRVSLLGGSFSIQSRTEQAGTVVRAAIPLRSCELDA